MNRKYFLVLALSTIFGRLYAQDTVKSSLLDEVVVTATKYPVKSISTGKVVTVITREQIERNGGKDLSQLLNEQAGLYINGANSNPGKDKSVYLRGARIDHTLITIDGIPVYDPSGIGGNFDIRNITPEQIERIEILKGSQSTLYGSDAIAGVINFITRKAPSRPLAAHGLLSYGTYGTKNGSLVLEGAKGKFSYRSGYGMQSSAGIDETLKENNTDKGDRDPYVQKGLFAEFGLKPSGPFELKAFYRLTKLSGALDQGAYTDELDYSYRQRSMQTGLRSQWVKDRFTLNFLYQYNTVERIYTDDSTQSRNGFDIYSNGSYRGGEHVADLYIPISIAPKLKLLLGSDLRQSSTTQQFRSVAEYGNYTSHYAADSLHQTQWSTYSTLQFSSGRNWNIEAGGRINHHSSYGWTPVFNFNPSYVLYKRIKLFGTFSSGYRTPSLYQLFSEYGNSGLRPERAVNGELGIRLSDRNQKILVGLLGFERRTKNMIYFSFDPATYNARYINQDRQQDHGLEFEFEWHPLPSLALRTNYQYVTGRITTLENGKDTTYDNLLRRPTHSGNISLSYRVNKYLFLSTLLQYNSSRKDSYFDLQQYERKNVMLGAYTLWEVYGEYKISAPFRLFFNLRNINNILFNEVAGFRTMGRNVHIGFRYAL